MTRPRHVNDQYPRQWRNRQPELGAILRPIVLDGYLNHWQREYLEARGHNTDKKPSAKALVALVDRELQIRAARTASWDELDEHDKRRHLYDQCLANRGTPLADHEIKELDDIPWKALLRKRPVQIEAARHAYENPAPYKIAYGQPTIQPDGTSTRKSRKHANTGPRHIAIDSYNRLLADLGGSAWLANTPTQKQAAMYRYVRRTRDKGRPERNPQLAEMEAALQALRPESGPPIRDEATWYLVSQAPANE